LANAYPKEFSTMIRLCQSYDYGSASQIWSNWLDLNPLLYEEGNPVGIKAVLAQMGVCQPFVRLPLANASSDLTARIRKSMA
ncbi:MAG TPA: dihydrodipicolinate synthase family protein, partial [Catalimonadaceae bacterium]|nr:dihydrodipicolinate synthase family protein [Catalimonadaceae bacterium]